MMARLDDILKSHVAQGDDTTDKLLGATFAVLDKDGNIKYQGSAGRSDFSLDSPAYTPETPTMIMSMTKLITATCVLQLVERGLVTLDEDVRPRLPELAKLQLLKGFDDAGQPILEDNTKAITLRQLLTHTSGITYDIADPEVMKWSAAIGRTDHALSWNVSGFACPLVYPPGEGWMYSSALDWAGFVLEQVTGKKLGAYMTENIFTPLGMKDTTFWPHARADLKDRLAATPFRPTNEEGGGEPLVPAPSPAPVEHEVESGGAGLYSTAADYVKFVAAIMRGDKALFAKPETRELLFAPQLDDVQRAAMRDVVARLQSSMAPEFPPGLAIDFAFGGMVNMEDVPGRRRKGSVMWSGLANAHWWIDRATGIAGVFFTTVLRNPPGDPVAIRLYRELEEAVYADVVGK